MPHEDKTMFLGPEYDPEATLRVGGILAQLGRTPRLHDWNVAGSRELERLAIMLDSYRLVVEAETFVALSLRTLGSSNVRS
jgi:hypothetical protein